MRMYGTMRLKAGAWTIECEPDIAIRLKRIFRKGDRGAPGRLLVTHNPENARDLVWVLDRYPMEVTPRDVLFAAAQAHTDRILRVEEYLGEGYEPREFDMALPPRTYQAREAEVLLAQGYLLVADDVGLGKTWTAAAAISDPAARPAVVVTLTHLPKQWARELERAMPDLHVHVAKKGTAYPLPSLLGRSPDVVILSYSKLRGWAQVLRGYARLVVFDEIQELRLPESQKYAAAQVLVEKARFRLGLSATPIYNYGEEIRNVLEILKPGILGSKTEFVTEWCAPAPGGKSKLKDPRAFGSWARREAVILRHTREQVGRELPPVTKIVQPVDSDSRALAAIQDAAVELAKIILSGEERARGAKMLASEEFSNKLRQATGIAKAPYVAEFARMLVEAGETVVLCGWHRAVYDVWEAKLSGLRVAKYTGSETGGEKDQIARRFRNRELDVLILSLRSGAGLDGLQEAGSVMVFGELDWSPGVHEQCIGRLWRDGQERKVVAYFLVAEDGADPVIAEILGLKTDQVLGIVNPDTALVEKLESDPDRVRRLAEEYLKRKGEALPPAEAACA